MSGELIGWAYIALVAVTLVVYARINARAERLQAELNHELRQDERAKHSAGKGQAQPVPPKKQNRWEPVVLPESRVTQLPTLPSGPRPEGSKTRRRRTRKDGGMR